MEEKPVQETNRGGGRHHCSDCCKVSQYSVRHITPIGVLISSYALHLFRRIHTRLTEDHLATLRPDIETPFQDQLDVVKRLLPYHVYQHPMEDLIPLAYPAGKGKMKATEEDLLREEIAGAPPCLVVVQRRPIHAGTFHQRRDSRCSVGSDVRLLKRDFVELRSAQARCVHRRIIFSSRVFSNLC